MVSMGVLATVHARIPLLKSLPLRALAIISSLALVNILAWTAVGIVLVSSVNPCPGCADVQCLWLSIFIRKWLESQFYTSIKADYGSGLVGTAVLAYTLGLRHALDADHISVRWSTLEKMPL